MQNNNIDIRPEHDEIYDAINAEILAKYTREDIKKIEEKTLMMYVKKNKRQSGHPDGDRQEKKTRLSKRKRNRKRKN